MSSDSSNAVEKTTDNKKAIKNIFYLLKEYKIKLILTVVCAIISTIFTIISPLFIGRATTIIYHGINNILANTGELDFPSLIYCLGVVVVLYILSALFTYLKNYFLGSISAKISYNLRLQIMDKITALGMDNVDANKRGDLLSRLTNDVDSLEVGITDAFIEIITAIITIIGVFAMMLYINVWMTVATVVIIPVAFVIIIIVTKFSQKYFASQLMYKGKVNGLIEESFTGHDIIRAYNQEELSIETFDNDTDQWYGHEWKSQFFSSLTGPMMEFISNLEYIIIAVLGAIFVLQGAIAVGDILAFIQYMENFTTPIQQITMVMGLVQNAMGATERIFEFLELEDEQNSSNKKLTELNDSITFENVTFGYTPDKKIIDNLSFEVKKGQKVAILGGTGAGKTTIIKLLLRFYDLDGGSIKIDGVDITEYDKNSLRALVGIVLQESWLFSDTIANNIRYGDLDASDEQVIEASKKVYADNFIRQLPEGYDTVLNEDADNISHGQKQLLTIARTILSQKDLLILDEATSSVDTRTEKLIQKAMNKLMEGRTSLIIAHRLSTIKNSDNIIVLENGSILEQGTHEELLAQRGYYYNTLNAQNKR